MRKANSKPRFIAAMCPKCGSRVWLPGTFAKRQRECGEVFVVKAVSPQRARAAGAARQEKPVTGNDPNVIRGKCNSCGRQLRLPSVVDRLNIYCPSCGAAIRLIRTPVGQEELAAPDPAEALPQNSLEDYSQLRQQADRTRLMCRRQDRYHRRARWLAAAIGLTANVLVASLFWLNREAIGQWLRGMLGG